MPQVVLVMHSQYRINCPICDNVQSVKIGETQTIYYIEAYENRNSVRSFFMKSKPVEKKGQKAVINDEWVEISDVVCEEGHVIKAYHSHYTKVSEEDQRHGPEKQPSIYCPNCSANLGDHENHIIKLDADLDMQYVLRSVSLEESTNHKSARAITKKNARNYDQICIPRSCGHCNADVYFNYSSRNLNKSESYKGVRSV